MSTIPVQLQSPVSTPTSSNTTIGKLSDSMNNLVGPISDKYCIYFYILSVLAIFFFVVIIIAIIFIGIKKKMGVSFFFLSILYSMHFLLAYLQNRLLYNMCIHSVV